MKNIPFYMGVLLIIPVKEQPAGPQKLPNGIGVGAVMTAELAIRHESIKDNIRHQALLFSAHQATQAIENIMNNIRYVSIENTWYTIIREVSKVSLLRKAIAGAGGLLKHNGGQLQEVTEVLRQGTPPDQVTTPAAGTELFAETGEEDPLPDYPRKVVVTAFATPDLSGMAKASGQPGCEMAIVVERYQPF